MFRHFGVVVLSGIAVVLNYNMKPYGYEMCKSLCSRVYGCQSFSFCPTELSCCITNDRDQHECQYKQNFFLSRFEQHGFSHASTNLSCPTFSKMIHSRRNSIQCVAQSPRATAKKVTRFLVAQTDMPYGTFRIVNLEESKETRISVQVANVTSFAYAASRQSIITSSRKPADVMSYPLNGAQGVLLKKGVGVYNMAVDDHKGFVFLLINGKKNRIARIRLVNHAEIRFGGIALYHDISLDTKHTKIYLCVMRRIAKISYDGRWISVPPLQKHADALTLDPTRGILFYIKDNSVFEKNLTRRSTAPGNCIAKLNQRFQSLIYKDGLLYMTNDEPSNDIGAIDIRTRSYNVLRLHYKRKGVLKICLFP